jgi:hypothetical protein
MKTTSGGTWISQLEGAWISQLEGAWISQQERPAGFSNSIRATGLHYGD